MDHMAQCSVELAGLCWSMGMANAAPTYCWVLLVQAPRAVHAAGSAWPWPSTHHPPGSLTACACKHTGSSCVPSNLITGMGLMGSTPSAETGFPGPYRCTNPGTVVHQEVGDWPTCGKQRGDKSVIVNADIEYASSVGGLLSGCHSLLKCDPLLVAVFIVDLQMHRCTESAVYCRVSHEHDCLGF